MQRRSAKAATVSATLTRPLLRTDLWLWRSDPSAGGPSDDSFGGAGKPETMAVLDRWWKAAPVEKSDDEVAVSRLNYTTEQHTSKDASGTEAESSPCPADVSHCQVHTAWAGAQRMRVSWASAAARAPVVRFGPTPANLSLRQPATTESYALADFCNATSCPFAAARDLPDMCTKRWEDPGQLHHALLDLSGLPRIFFAVGDADATTSSATFGPVSDLPRARGAALLSFAAFGDMGVGAVQSSIVARLGAEQSGLDFVFHVGDLACGYSTCLSSPRYRLKETVAANRRERRRGAVARVAAADPTRGFGCSVDDRLRQPRLPVGRAALPSAVGGVFCGRRRWWRVRYPVQQSILDAGRSCSGEQLARVEKRDAKQPLLCDRTRLGPCRDAELRARPPRGQRPMALAAV